MSPCSTSSPPAAFRRLAWSNLLAQSAEQIGLAAAPIVAVLALGAGPAETGWLQAAQTLPFLLLALPAGVLADRASRARLMASGEALRMVSLLGILAAVLSGWLSIPLLAALGLVGAIGTVAYSVAAPALVPGLVPRESLVAANGRLELARTLAFAAGPALGGVLIGWIGASAAFLIAAILSGVAMLLLSGLAEPTRVMPPRRHPIQELREGAAMVFAHPLLRPVLLTASFFNTAFFVLQAVYVPYAVERLGLSPVGVGATLATYGLGMVAGAALTPRVARAVTFGWLVAIGPIAGFAAALVMLATVWLPSAALAGLSFFLVGAGPTIWVISTATLRQTVTPARLLGRASAVITTATQGARPIGAAIGALVGGAWGVEACLAVATLGFLVQMLIILLSPVRRLHSLPAAAE